MGTVSSSLPSTSLTNTPATASGSSSTSSNPTGIFTGTSTYSQDFQNVIDRAVAIASLPINLLTAQQTTLTNQSNELQTLDTKFTALQTAIQGIDSALGGASFETDISDTKVASATLADGATEGVYSIDVTDPGSYATSLSSATWDSTPDPSGNSTTYTLMIGSSPYTFTPSDNSAATVASTINSQYGDMVNATAVNIGTADIPDWRVSLQSATLGNQDLDIQQNGVGLQSQQQPPGDMATYVVNNSGLPVTSDSRSVTVSNGVTLNILAAGTTDVTVTRSTSALSSALSTFVNAYNAAVTEIGTQHGQSAGPLQGQSILSTLSQTLSGISTYNDTTGTINGIGDLGLTLEATGQIAYDQFALAGADISNSQGITAFLGSAAGGGFLEAATNALTNLEDPTNGLLKNAETDTQTQLTTIGNNIADKTNQVDQLQLQMQNQMAQADAAIASMQQQYSYMSSMFSAMQTADQMYANG